MAKDVEDTLLLVLLVSLLYIGWMSAPEREPVLPTMTIGVRG